MAVLSIYVLLQYRTKQIERYCGCLHRWQPIDSMSSVWLWVRCPEVCNDGILESSRRVASLVNAIKKDAKEVRILPAFRRNRVRYFHRGMRMIDDGKRG